MTAFIIYNI